MYLSCIRERLLWQSRCILNRKFSLYKNIRILRETDRKIAITLNNFVTLKEKTITPLEALEFKRSVFFARRSALLNFT